MVYTSKYTTGEKKKLKFVRRMEMSIHINF